PVTDAFAAGTGKNASSTCIILLYAGSVEAARANERQLLPVGAASLRHASSLMHQDLLLAADRLYGVEARRLEHEFLSAGSGSDVAVVVAVMMAALALLVGTQLFLIRRTNRIFNVPLVATPALAGALCPSLVTRV